MDGKNHLQMPDEPLHLYLRFAVHLRTLRQALPVSAEMGRLDRRTEREILPRGRSASNRGSGLASTAPKISKRLGKNTAD